jgi:L-alanine-DL-glutamate epimerase-like enolase superfamily enzyme
MKITRVETIVLEFPPAETLIKDAIHTFGDARGGLIVKLHTDADYEGEALAGWGYIFFGMVKGAPRSLKTIVDEMLAPAVIGEDPHAIRRIRQKLWAAVEYVGWTGLVHMGIAAIDVALYDVVTKAAKLPGWRWFGGVRDRIPAYAMVGWYYDSDTEFERACADAIAEGFSDLKIKVGIGSLAEDMKRIRIAKKVVGEGRVMVDANQAYNAEEALRRGRAYQDADIFWYEEPMLPEDLAGYVKLAEALDVPIATGENLYGAERFREYIEAGGVDILQPDNRRAGGPTDWLAIGALGETFRKPIASHGGGAANVHLLCSMPTAIYLESGSLKDQDFHVGTLTLKDGAVLAPEDIGMGTEVRPHVIDQHRVA